MSTAIESGIGVALPRYEDRRLLMGLGRYTDDIRPPGCAHACIVRSPHAAARIVQIDVAAARSEPGVLAVLTGADALADGIGTITTPIERKRRGEPMPRPIFGVLALDAVHFAGDAVALVIAETPAAAQDAAERVEVQYDSLPSVTDVADAVAPAAPPVWPELAPDNVCFTYELGDRAAVAAQFARAAHLTRLEFRISRVSANPIEPRAALGVYDAGQQRYTLYTGVQAPHTVRNDIAANILRIPTTRLRVVSPDVGGGFGMKGGPYPEHGLVLWAARRVGRPVRWTATRSESFLADYHARDNVSEVELALAADGEFLALRVRTLANLGAYLGVSTPLAPVNNLGSLAGVYRTPAIHAEVQGIFTNTQPTAPYRGAGRPEAIHALERVIDLAAEELGIDRVALRRRNLIPPAAMPFRTGLVYTYDCGDFPSVMTKALAAADWDGFAVRRSAAAARGRLRGISVVNAIEIAGGPAGAPLEEAADIAFDAAGDITVRLGTHNHGQGHETTFRQILVTHLGIDPERVRVVAGDTDAIAHGRGTFGSRSAAAGGTALVRAAEKIVGRARMLAAHLLEAAEVDLVFEHGSFRIAGTDRSVRLEEVARASYRPGGIPSGQEPGLAERAIAAPAGATFPNGCHVCEVEIDPETGAVEVVGYVVVDDVGTVINPLLLKGQIHGGVAQGLGQALGESVRFDGATGQLLTGSFMDYTMPRAADLPPIEVHSHPVPTAHNPLGVKGAGEAGTVGALPAAVNALVDALRPLGIRHLDMPATPARIWAAISNAAQAASLEPGRRT